MSQRTRAGLLALSLLAVLCGTAMFAPLPYVTYRPGPTVDILAETDGEETVQVTGHQAYYDDGELRMTTVYVSSPEERVSLTELLQGLLRPATTRSGRGRRSTPRRRPTSPATGSPPARWCRRRTPPSRPR